MREPCCPVCVGQPSLEPITAVAVRLLQCGRCRGVWAHSDAVTQPGLKQGHEVLTKPLRPHGCRRCGSRLRAARPVCLACGAHQVISCVECLAPMARLRVDTVVVDVCRPCRSAWFDAGELPVFARVGQTRLLTPAQLAGEDRRGTAFDGFFDGTDVAVHGVELLSEGVTHLPGVVQAAGEGVVGGVEVVGEGTVQVISTVGEVAVEGIGTLLAGLFDGL